MASNEDLQTQLTDLQVAQTIMAQDFAAKVASFTEHLEAKLAGVLAEVAHLRNEVERADGRASTMSGSNELDILAFVGDSISPVTFAFAAGAATSTGDPDASGLTEGAKARLKMISPFPNSKDKVDLDPNDSMKMTVDEKRLRLLAEGLEEFATTNKGLLPFEFWQHFMTYDAIKALKAFAASNAARFKITGASPILKNPLDHTSDAISIPTTAPEWYCVITYYLSQKGPTLLEQLKTLPRYHYDVLGDDKPDPNEIFSRVEMVFDKAVELSWAAKRSSLMEAKAGRVIMNAIQSSFPGKFVSYVLDKNDVGNNGKMTPARSLKEWKELFTLATISFIADEGMLGVENILFHKVDRKADDSKAPKAPAGDAKPKGAAKATNSTSTMYSPAAGGAAGGWTTVGASRAAAGGAAKPADVDTSKPSGTESWNKIPCDNCGHGEHAKRACTASFCRQWVEYGECKVKNDRCKFKAYHTPESKLSKPAPPRTAAASKK
jgi:hypothetical protein